MHDSDCIRRGQRSKTTQSLAVSIPFFSSYCTSRLFLTFVWATRLGFTSPTFVQLDLFPHLRLLTLCLASLASAWHVLGFPSLTHLEPFGLGLSVPVLASLQLSSWPHPLLSNWHAASPEKYFCSASAGSRLTKRKKNFKTAKTEEKKSHPRRTWAVCSGKSTSELNDVSDILRPHRILDRFPRWVILTRSL